MTSQCNYKLLQDILCKPTVTGEIIHLFFFLLVERSAINCMALSPEFLDNIFRTEGSSISAAKAAQLLSQKQIEALLSADFIFLPFFDTKNGYWNLIALSDSIPECESILPCLHFFGSSSGKTIEIRQRLFLR